MELKERIELTTGLYTVVQGNFKTAYEYFEWLRPADALDYTIDLFIEHAVEVFSYRRRVKIKVKVQADEYLHRAVGKLFLTSKKRVIDIISPFCFADTVPADELIPIKQMNLISHFDNIYKGYWDRPYLIEDVFADKLVKVIVQSLCVMFSGVLKGEGIPLHVDSTGALVR